MKVGKEGGTETKSDRYSICWFSLQMTYNGWSLARLKLGDRNFIWVFHEAVRPSSTWVLFYCGWRLIGIETQRLGLELELQRDAGLSGGSLAYYDTSRPLSP